MADIDRVELLIGLSNNMRTENDEWRKQVWREGRERALRVKEMIARIEKEFGLLHQELELVRQYLPREEPLPKAVTQGPRQ